MNSPKPWTVGLPVGLIHLRGRAMENHKDGSGPDSYYPRHDVEGETCASPCGNAARDPLGSVLLPAQVLAHHTGAYFGSIDSHNCDATPLSQCVANNGSHIHWFDADLIDVRRTAMSAA